MIVVAVNHAKIKVPAFKLVSHLAIDADVKVPAFGEIVANENVQQAKKLFW